MKTTPTYALPYPEPADHTRTWEYWQGLADRIEAMLKTHISIGGNINAGVNVYAANGSIIAGSTASGSQRQLEVNMLVGALPVRAFLEIVGPGQGCEIMIMTSGVSKARLQFYDNLVLRVTDPVSGTSRALPFATFTAAPTVSTAGLTVTFPVGLFTQPPVCHTNQRNDPNWISSAQTITTTSCVIKHNIGTSGWTVDLIAIQATPTGATAFAAGTLADEPAPARVVTCHTAECGNADAPIEIPTPEGDVTCGVCLQPITDLVAL